MCFYNEKVQWRQINKSIQHLLAKSGTLVLVTLKTHNPSQCGYKSMDETTLIKIDICAHMLLYSDKSRHYKSDLFRFF